MPSTVNVTVPVGVPAPVVTDVKVSGCPYMLGFVDELTAVVLPAIVTVCVIGADVEVRKLASPLYLAVTE